MHTTTMHSCFVFYNYVSDKQKDLKIRYILFYITHLQCPKAWTLDQGNMHLIIKVDSLKNIIFMHLGFPKLTWELRKSQMARL